MHINDIPLELQQSLPSFSPTVQHYIVTDHVERRQGIMDDIGGEDLYGPDWELIVAGDHPMIEAEELVVTLH